MQEEREDHAAAIESLEGQLAMQKAETRATRVELEGQLATLRSEKEAREAELATSLASLQDDKEASELRLASQMKNLELACEQEKAVLRARADRLSKLQDQAVGSGSSTTARALLYFEKLKSKTRQEGSLSWRGENDTLLPLPEGDGTPTRDGGVPGEGGDEATGAQP